MTPVMKQAKKIYDIMYDDDFKTNIRKLLKVRIPIVQLCTTDERRVSCFFDHYCRLKGYNLYTWNCIDGMDSVTPGNFEDTKSIHDALAFILKDISKYKDRDSLKGKRGNIFLFSELEYYLNDPMVVRYLKKFYDYNAVSSIFFSSFDVPLFQAGVAKHSNLQNKIRIISPPSPSYAEYENIFDEMVENLTDKEYVHTDNHEKVADRAIADKLLLLEKIQGMDMQEAQITLAVQCVSYFDELQKIKNST